MGVSPHEHCHVSDHGTTTGQTEATLTPGLLLSYARIAGPITDPQQANEFSTTLVSRDVIV